MRGRVRPGSRGGAEGAPAAAQPPSDCCRQAGVQSDKEGAMKHTLASVWNCSAPSAAQLQPQLRQPGRHMRSGARRRLLLAQLQQAQRGHVRQGAIHLCLPND